MTVMRTTGNVFLGLRDPFPDMGVCATVRPWRLTVLAFLLAGWAGAVNAGTTERISVGPAGAEANGPSLNPVISAGGRYVAFWSDASNLVAGDTNGRSDIFVRDRQAGATELISLGPDGSQGNSESESPAISASGRFVAFSSLSDNWVGGPGSDFSNVFVRDRLRLRTQRVSIGLAGARPDNGSDHPRVSPGGRYVVFDSAASNLIAGDRNGFTDVFLFDRQTGRTERVSLTAGGGEANGTSVSGAVSSDGRFVAFASRASNLVPGDTNGSGDVFVRDRLTGRTERISVGPGGVQGNRDSDEVASMSVDGSRIAFVSKATNLAPGFTRGSSKAFVRDRSTGHTVPVASTPTGGAANGSSYYAVIALDGRFVAFTSGADNLVPGDRNHAEDNFVRDLQQGRTDLVSLAANGAQACSALLSMRRWRRVAGSWRLPPTHPTSCLATAMTWSIFSSASDEEGCPSGTFRSKHY